MEQRTVTANGIRMRIAERGGGTARAVAAWLSRVLVLVAPPAPGARRCGISRRGTATSAATAAPTPRRPSRATTSSISSTTPSASSMCSAKSERWSWATTGERPWRGTARFSIPQRFRAVAALSVPYVGRSPLPPLDMFRAMAGEHFFYILYFQSRAWPSASSKPTSASTMRRFLYAASGRRHRAARFLAQAKDREVPRRASRSEEAARLAGRGRPRLLHERVSPHGISRRPQLVPQHRSQLAAHRRTRGSARSTQPALFIAGERDGVLAMIPVDAMRPLVPNLTALASCFPAAATGRSRSARREVNRGAHRVPEGALDGAASRRRRAARAKLGEIADRVVGRRHLGRELPLVLREPHHGDPASAGSGDVLTRGVADEQHVVRRDSASLSRSWRKISGCGFRTRASAEMMIDLEVVSPPRCPR